MDNIFLKDLLIKYPYVKDFFVAYQLDVSDNVAQDVSLREYIFQKIPASFWEKNNMKPQEFMDTILALISQVREVEKNQAAFRKVEKLTIKGGSDKDGKPEKFEEITVYKGEIISVVGPTGSGKSQLLADIEWLADGDTVSGRKILLNDAPVPRDIRYSTDKKPVAQLSQNMNFVLDVTVEEFLRLHAESRMIADVEVKIKEILEVANMLAGEKISLSTPVTSLSGGQSRALMIADTGILSRSPIVLIDEIENAGINKQKALEFLLSAEKLIFIATHDPILSLLADKRLVIRNGGIEKIITTTQEEKENLEKLLKFNDYWNRLRERIRSGETLKLSDFQF